MEKGRGGGGGGREVANANFPPLCVRQRTRMWRVTTGDEWIVLSITKPSGTHLCLMCFNSKT